MILLLALLAGCRDKVGSPDTASYAETADTGPGCASTKLWYADADGDGYGSGLDPVEACAQPAGYLADAGDCDDADPNVHPGAAEICDGIDQNCNGEIDEGEPADGTLYFVDADGDGYGDPATGVLLCAAPAGGT